MADTAAVRKKLEQIIASTNHTFREVSLNIGRKDSYIQQYIKYGLPKRLNEIDRKRVCRFLDIEESELIDDELLRDGMPESPLLKLDDISDNLADFIAIDIYDPQPRQALHNHVIGRIAINYKEFFGWCNGNPYNLKMIRLNSDAMEPTVPSGSLIIYDSCVLEFSGDGLYILRYDDQIMLKRLQMTSPDHFLLKSENPRYQDIRCDASEVEVLGRAINCLASRPL